MQWSFLRLFPCWLRRSAVRRHFAVDRSFQTKTRSEYCTVMNDGVARSTCVLGSEENSQNGKRVIVQISTRAVEVLFVSSLRPRFVDPCSKPFCAQMDVHRIVVQF